MIGIFNKGESSLRLNLVANKGAEEVGFEAFSYDDCIIYEVDVKDDPSRLKLSFLEDGNVLAFSVDIDYDSQKISIPTR